MNKKRVKTGKLERKGNTGAVIIMLFFCVIVLLPILWMISTSIKIDSEMVAAVPRWIPETPSLVAYQRFFKDYPFLMQLKNTVIYTLCSTILIVICACFAGYGVTRFEFRGKNAFMSFLLVTQMLPSVMLLVPFYNVIKSLGLLNTYIGMILVYISISVAFATWMMMGFFKSIPLELDEAAIIDGCSRFQTFLKVIMPLTLPGIASVAIFSFITGWNEYMFTSILTTQANMQTITIGITSLNGERVMWNDMMAASVISSIPLVIVFMFLQKYFVSGMTSGAVKG